MPQILICLAYPWCIFFDFSLISFQVSYSDELKHRLIHLLVSGELTHSEVMKNMDRDCEKTEIKVEDILHNIADLVTSKKDTTKVWIF